MFFAVNRLSVSIQSMFFWPSVPNYAPFHGWPLWYAGRARYTECWGTIPQYTVSQSLVLVTHWYSLHPHHPHHQQHHLLLLTLRRVSWNFFRVSLCQFYYEVPWFSWAVFQLSFLWVSLATSHEVYPFAWPSREASDLSGPEPDGPSWASLVLNVFGHL
jgi:hypothetical protein